MKKTLAIGCLLAVASAFAEDVTLGEVGVTAISSKLTNTIVAVSYDDLGGGSGIVVSNFVKTTNLTAGDRLAVFNGATYDTWLLTEKSGVKVWEKAAKTFTIGSDGVLTEGTGAAADTTVKAVGTGIWLCRQNPVDGSGNAIPFYIYGKPVSNPTSTIAANTWTLVGNPKQVSVDLTSRVSGVQNRDQIVYVGDDGKPLYYQYISGRGWVKNGAVPNLPVIGPGLGIWIYTKSDTTINW